MILRKCLSLADSGNDQEERLLPNLRVTAHEPTPTSRSARTNQAFFARIVIFGNLIRNHLNDQDENEMGEINISRDEQYSLKAIDADELDKLIEKCLDEKRPGFLRILRLENCGPYVASNLRAFERALGEYGIAKAAKKRAETENRARRAGSDLVEAVRQMKHRVETEEKEVLRFYVDDQIMPPYRFSEHLTVRVSYRWRPAIEDEWISARITFTHDVDSRPDYSKPLLKRKPSAGKQDQDRQDELYREWEHLMRLGVQSVREYFREGGNGAAIPQTFQAKTDSYTCGLNNFSAQFWLVRSLAVE